MPKPQTIVLTGGQEVVGEEISFEPVRESWSVYRLDDGSYLKVRALVGRVFRVVDEEGNPTYLDTGDPFMVARNRVEIVYSEVG